MSERIYHQLSAVIFDCKGIHLQSDITLGDGSKSKVLRPGMDIRIDHHEIVDCSGDAATHRIRDCKTNATFTMALLNAFHLKTGELTTINFSG